MDFEDLWEDLGIRIGPFGFGFHGQGRPVRYTRTEKFHVLKIKINPDVKKEEIKVRLTKPGVLEIEWPRKVEGEEIPVE
ncbi:MAG: hypothetical protein AB1410_06840 [Acidobacteriota bacterium]